MFHTTDVMARELPLDDRVCPGRRGRVASPV